MKVKIIAHWKHGFIMEDDIEMLEGSSSVANPEQLSNYYNSVNNINNWWITDEKGNTLYSKEKPFKREIQKTIPKRTKKEKDYSTLSKEELIAEAKRLLPIYNNNATKVATIIGKSPTFVRTNTK